MAVNNVAATDAHSGGLRVLIVEDDRDTANTIATWLHLVGHESEICRNGRDAEACVRRGDHDVVMIDIGLPDLNGYEVTRKLDEARREDRPLLIAITSSGREEDRRRSADAGIDWHLLKPVDLDHLELILLDFSLSLQETPPGKRAARRKRPPIS